MQFSHFNNQVKKSFCQNSSIKDQTVVVRETLPEVHIHNVAVGPDPDMDKANTVFMRCVDQVIWQEHENMIMNTNHRVSISI